MSMKKLWFREAKKRWNIESKFEIQSTSNQKSSQSPNARRYFLSYPSKTWSSNKRQPLKDTQTSSLEDISADKRKVASATPNLTLGERSSTNTMFSLRWQRNFTTYWCTALRICLTSIWLFLMSATTQTKITSIIWSCETSFSTSSIPKIPTVTDQRSWD